MRRLARKLTNACTIVAMGLLESYLDSRGERHIATGQDLLRAARMVGDLRRERFPRPEPDSPQGPFYH